MAKSMGSDAKSNSRRCLTFAKVTAPSAPRTPLPTKLAVAEKHMACRPQCVDYTVRRRLRAAGLCQGARTDSQLPAHLSRRCRSAVPDVEKIVICGRGH